MPDDNTAEEALTEEEIEVLTAIAGAIAENNSATLGGITARLGFPLVATTSSAFGGGEGDDGGRAEALLRYGRIVLSLALKNLVDVPDTTEPLRAEVLIALPPK